MIATWTFIDEPLVENSVCLAPTASANSSCAVLCTFQARSRVSSPWLIGRSMRAASPPRHLVNSGAGPRPPLCAGMLNVSMSRRQKSRIASAMGTVDWSFETGLRRSSTFSLALFLSFSRAFGSMSIRYPAYDRRMPTLSVADPLAHRALEALMRAEAHVRRGIATELQRAGLSTGAFSVLVVLTTAGGELELRTLRRRLGWSKANATDVTAALERQGLVVRRRLVNDRRAMAVGLSADGAELVQRVFPTHADHVSAAFARLDEDEKRSLTLICRKLAA